GILAAYAMESEDFAAIVGTRHIQAAGRSLVDHNKLLWRYPGALGIKTGYTRASGRSLVSAAERDGTRLICVTLSAPDDWDDHSALYDWGFANFKYHRILGAGAVVVTVPVISGVAAEVTLIAEGDLGLLTGVTDEVQVVIEGPRFVFAGVGAGETAGLVYVTVNGERVLETRLVYGDTVELDEANRLSGWEMFKWRLGRLV
ncbi:MAG: D-alanyl-D-alanine carboxypeptidase, partial [Oscillospiraceae bacterium]|nr:D-alanyl-D-alanine carboxypeptidase [Oscillospiraceae bacterium]